MTEQFPIEYELESGTKVTVNKTADRTYDFSLRPTEGPGEHFTYIDDNRPKSEWDEQLEFEQLDALRTFWLKQEEVI